MLHPHLSCKKKSKGGKSGMKIFLYELKKITLKHTPPYRCTYQA